MSQIVSNMSHDEKPVAAFVLGLMGGVFILLGAVVMSVFAFGSMSMMMGMMSMGGMMSMTQIAGFIPLLTIFGLFSGVNVLIGSWMLYQRPSENQMWGGIVLGFSMLSLIGAMGGLMVGLVLGIISGVLGLTWRNPRKI